MPDEAFEPLAKRLTAEGRRPEGAGVELLGLLYSADAARSLVQFPKDIAVFVARVCNYAIAVSRESGFTECDACFARALGTGLGKRCQWPPARALLTHALGLYRDLGNQEPHVYRPEVAMTLNNLGNVLREERSFPAARAAFQEGLKLYSESAVQEPHIYRPYVAGMLNNLGNVLAQERSFLRAAGRSRRRWTSAVSWPTRSPISTGLRWR